MHSTLYKCDRVFACYLYLFVQHLVLSAHHKACFGWSCACHRQSVNEKNMRRMKEWSSERLFVDELCEWNAWNWLFSENCQSFAWWWLNVVIEWFILWDVAFYICLWMFFSCFFSCFITSLSLSYQKHIPSSKAYVWLETQLMHFTPLITLHLARKIYRPVFE